MTTDHHTLTPPLAPLALGLAVALLGCSSAPKSKGGANSAVKLVQSTSFSESLNLDGGDEILALGRLDTYKVAASAKSGKAFDVDVENDKITVVEPWFKFDGNASSVFTVSSAYTWVLYHDAGQVGRNKNPPDANHKFEISKVPVDDLVKDTTALTPISATPDQLFLLSKSSLVAFTFQADAINRKKIPLPDGQLRDKEYVLGAGPIDDPAKDYGLWLATNQRLLKYLQKNQAWTSEALEVKSAEEAPSLISMLLMGKDGVSKAEAIGLFGANVLTSLDKPSTKKK